MFQDLLLFCFFFWFSVDLFFKVGHTKRPIWDYSFLMFFGISYPGHTSCEKVCLITYNLHPSNRPKLHQATFSEGRCIGNLSRVDTSMGPSIPSETGAENPKKQSPQASASFFGKKTTAPYAPIEKHGLFQRLGETAWRLFKRSSFLGRTRLPQLTLLDLFERPWIFPPRRQLALNARANRSDLALAQWLYCGLQSVLVCRVRVWILALFGVLLALFVFLFFLGFCL